MRTSWQSKGSFTLNVGTRKMASWFSDVTAAAPIEVFALTAKFKEDQYENKVNLGVGAYRTPESKPWVLPVVKKVEAMMAADDSLNHEYLPVAGQPEYRTAATKLLLGETSGAITENLCGGVQACGGTGALRVGLAFLKKSLHCSTVYVSNPTWGNHKSIAKDLGYENVKEYRYWDPVKKGLDFAGFCEDLRNAPAKSVILLHAVAHNPTGMDPTMEQWNQLATIIREKRLFPFFDCAYQGFASGDLDQDAASLRAFVKQGFELFAAQSFSKNFGLYNERVGQLVYVVNNSDRLSPIQTQMELLVRVMWSNPPAHGGRVVAHVLNNKQLFAEWRDNVKTMANRILDMRRLLLEKLRSLNTPGDWGHITGQAGMFSYTGLNERQSISLVEKHHVYLLKCGRINMCGVTPSNVDYVARAIHDVVTTIIDEPKL